jgi:hypothetical protein
MKYEESPGPARDSIIPMRAAPELLLVLVLVLVPLKAELPLPDLTA